MEYVSEARGDILRHVKLTKTLQFTFYENFCAIYVIKAGKSIIDFSRILGYLHFKSKCYAYLGGCFMKMCDTFKLAWVKYTIC